MVPGKYKENLRIPLGSGLAVTLLIGTIFWVIMQQALFGFVRLMVPPWPFLCINYCLPLIFICLFPMVKTSVRRGILSVRFSMGRNYIEHIPMENILSCRRHDYHCSPWHLVFSNYYQDDLQKIPLPGFRGDGLLLTYRKENFFTGEKHSSRILIPTKRVEELVSRLHCKL